MRQTDQTNTSRFSPVTRALHATSDSARAREPLGAVQPGRATDLRAPLGPKVVVLRVGWIMIKFKTRDTTVHQSKIQRANPHFPGVTLGLQSMQQFTWPHTVPSLQSPWGSLPPLSVTPRCEPVS